MLSINLKVRSGMVSNSRSARRAICLASRCGLWQAAKARRTNNPTKQTLFMKPYDLFSRHHWLNDFGANSGMTLRSPQAELR